MFSFTREGGLTIVSLFKFSCRFLKNSVGSVVRNDASIEIRLPDRSLRFLKIGEPDDKVSVLLPIGSSAVFTGIVVEFEKILEKIFPIFVDCCDVACRGCRGCDVACRGCRGCVLSLKLCLHIGQRLSLTKTRLKCCSLKI